jgi:hypothetical protein
VRWRITTFLVVLLCAAVFAPTRYQLLVGVIAYALLILPCLLKRKDDPR